MSSILVVDDDAAVRRLVTTWLKAQNFTVYEADTGSQAIEMAQQSAPDLIIMDVMLPDITGFVATERIRKIPGFRSTPVIALTGLDMRIDVAHEAGCTDLLLKPVDRDTLLNAVKRHLKSKVSG
jgi:CheY-like chemotaxis protein